METCHGDDEDNEKKDCESIDNNEHKHSSSRNRNNRYDACVQIIKVSWIEM